MGNRRLIYLPLGGAREVGMNAYVYGYGEPDNERLILVDLGVAFPNMETTPGIELIFPDMTWLEKRAERLEAIFITHGHEDHVGGIPHYYGDLSAPIFARPFTSRIISRKLSEYGHSIENVQTVLPWPKQIEAGPFKVSFLPVSHSIPESSSLVINTPVGRIIHTGDLKIDLNPVVGDIFDNANWRRVASKGVHALVCDSTNVFSNRFGRSESELISEIESLISRSNNLFVATTFASNIARIKTLACAGKRVGRSICLLGRAMKQMIETAIDTDVLRDFPEVIRPEDAHNIPRENLMLLVTGSQGERRAASAQLARGKYMGFELKKGDVFLFSSKTIPGNERGVLRVINQLSEKGVDVIDDSSGLYHVSGHANRSDLEKLHKLVDPKIVIPMHGEHRHLQEHVKLCEQNGIQSLLAVDGTMVDISKNKPFIADHIEAGRDYLDGRVIIGALDGVVRGRIRMALNGLVAIGIVQVKKPQISFRCDVTLIGLCEFGKENSLKDILCEEIIASLMSAKHHVLNKHESIKDLVRHVVRKTVSFELGKSPEITVIVNSVC
ncbi:MAG: ribonuclease J [Aestuariivita sp.]|nr:ribonuclease J [Aestuariivita sp.]